VSGAPVTGRIGQPAQRPGRRRQRTGLQNRRHHLRHCDRRCGPSPSSRSRCRPTIHVRVVHSSANPHRGGPAVSADTTGGVRVMATILRGPTSRLPVRAGRIRRHCLWCNSAAEPSPRPSRTSATAATRRALRRGQAEEAEQTRSTQRAQESLGRVLQHPRRSVQPYPACSATPTRCVVGGDVRCGLVPASGRSTALSRANPSRCDSVDHPQHGHRLRRIHRRSASASARQAALLAIPQRLHGHPGCGAGCGRRRRPRRVRHVGPARSRVISFQAAL
jgi:hypothetical protein